MTKKRIDQAAKCRLCKRAYGEHKAHTHHCPVGAKTRIGYLHFSLTDTFTPKP